MCANKTKTEIKDRTYRLFTGQDVDRIPDREFGYWPQTIRRWQKEGLGIELDDIVDGCFSDKLDAHFGMDPMNGFSCRVPIWQFINPPVEEEIIERKKDSVIMRDGNGVVAERYLHDSDESSIPRTISSPVKTPEDWKVLKEERYRIDDPMRGPDENRLAQIRAGQTEGRRMSLGVYGFYAQLRNWLGVEGLSYAFYDYPEMIHDMVERWTDLIVSQVNKFPDDILIDEVAWHEDLAGKSGPLLSPACFREFIQPGYHRVMEAAKKRGAVTGIVDSDGDITPIIPLWMEEGVDIMFPVEVTTGGGDPYTWRETFGMKLGLSGGIAKPALAEGGNAIDRELERIKPLMEQGRYVPHLDHLVSPDISLKNYYEYREKKMRLIRK